MEGPAWIPYAIGAIRVVSFICDVITFPIYLAVQQPWKRRQLSRRIIAKQISADNEQVTYRSIAEFGDMHNKLERENVDTLEKMLTYAVKHNGNKRCMGTRKILSEDNETQRDGKVFKKYSMGDYEWRSFTDLEDAATNFGRGLRELGHEARKNVVIFVETRAEWMISAQGCFKQNFPVATIYATLGDDGVAHGINETEATVVITSHELLPKFKTLLTKLPKVRTIVYMEDQLHETKTDGFRDGVRLISFDEVVRMGSTSNVVASPPTPDDIAIIMYTSGSTGAPKGVMLSHRNCMASLKGVSDLIKIYPDDVILGVLPLAHVMELFAESLCFLSGVPVGYSSPTTLTDASTKIKRGHKGDISVLKPTFMTSVPIESQKKSKTKTTSVVHSNGESSNFYMITNNRGRDEVTLCNRLLTSDLLFKKINAAIGGRIRLVLTGGAPLSADTQEFIKNMLCTDVLQGYGLTETTATGAATDADDMSFGRVGAPLISCDIRLVNWDEGGYRVTNKPHPQGEIIIGGRTVSVGYYKMEEKTAEDFFYENGRRWFKTGDIGEFHADGVLKIIDRKKDLVKLQAGEYISLGKVESELKTCPIVDNICVYAESSKQFCVALIVPNQKHLSDLARANGLPDDFEELCKSPVVNKVVVNMLAEHGRKCKLHKFEIPAAVTLCPEVWTPESGLVTAALKVKRKEVQDHYKQDINRMYTS